MSDDDIAAVECAVANREWQRANQPGYAALRASHDRLLKALEELVEYGEPWRVPGTDFSVAMRAACAAIAEARKLVQP